MELSKSHFIWSSEKMNDHAWKAISCVSSPVKLSASSYYKPKFTDIRDGCLPNKILSVFCPAKRATNLVDVISSRYCLTSVIITVNWYVSFRGSTLHLWMSWVKAMKHGNFNYQCCRSDLCREYSCGNSTELFYVSVFLIKSDVDLCGSGWSSIRIRD